MSAYFEQRLIAVISDYKYLHDCCNDDSQLEISIGSGFWVLKLWFVKNRYIKSLDGSQVVNKIIWDMCLSMSEEIAVRHVARLGIHIYIRSVALYRQS